MVELTKSQVLSQVGSAMLAQANRIQEGVLLLLRA
jgi:flagellin-like hook-associated protein FlgL